MNLGNGASSRGGRNSGHPLKSLTPKRILAIAAALIFLVFFFGRSSGGGRDGYWKAGTAASTDKAPNEAAVKVDKLPPNSPQKQQSASSGKCTPPKGQKATTYALMIDAGSTGSRIHVYTFSHCDPDPQALPKLENEGFFMTKPGLSSYAGKPREAAESLRGLMEHAIEGVPELERSCTPIAVKATAGLRLLGARQSQEILDEVERWLMEDWPFAVVKDGVVVMDGRDEGVYAWITINFLLGLIGPDQPASAGTAAIMDLGGASTQIVFEPIYDPGSRDKLAPGDHVYDLDFAGADHVLYQHSHLGYGLMQARRAVHNLVAFSYVWHSAPKGKAVKWEDLTPNDKIHNPCMFKGETKVVKLDPPGRDEVEVTMVGTGAGFEACRRVVEVMIAKDAACEKPPCAFAGVYQPKMGEVFSAGKVWALSYFYDRIAPLGLSSPFSISALRQLTSDVCAGREASSWSRFKNNKEAMEELSDRPEYCLDLTFMYSLLSLGYELDEERQVWMGKKVGNVELGWALGAALAMIEGHLSCRAE
ncbi:guanosine-diphosphatase [Rhodotorula toruloides]|uniref:guanosine-diphosphatase n=1 Tax=Rhodotorula toruloides TaxID=5286 RepID=A0A511KIE6_RHOTO|nr:guanosine-diphosphatase [Rhodotorula toruloides]